MIAADLKDSNVKIIVIRDSVCAGDDFNPSHEKVFRFRENKTLKSVLLQLVTDYLPKIAGGKATWVAETNIPIAVLAQQWKKTVLITKQTSISEVFEMCNLPRIHFKYFAQQDPRVVLMKLKN